MPTIVGRGGNRCGSRCRIVLGRLGAGGVHLPAHHAVELRLILVVHHAVTVQVGAILSALAHLQQQHGAITAVDLAVAVEIRARDGLAGHGGRGCVGGIAALGLRATRSASLHGFALLAHLTHRIGAAPRGRVAREEHLGAARAHAIGDPLRQARLLSVGVDQLLASRHQDVSTQVASMQPAVLRMIETGLTVGRRLQAELHRRLAIGDRNEHAEFRASFRHLGPQHEGTALVDARAHARLRTNQIERAQRHGGGVALDAGETLGHVVGRQLDIRHHEDAQRRFRSEIDGHAERLGARGAAHRSLIGEREACRKRNDGWDHEPDGE